MTWKTQPRSKFEQLTAITAGAGPKVVLIHGVGLRAEAWGAQMNGLSQSCNVMAVDMPGHGHSAPLSSDPRLADFTDVIAATLTEPALVIGHSFGAMIALDMAIKYPQKVQAVAALNGIYQRDAEAKAAVNSRSASLDGVTLADPTATLVRWFGSEQSVARNACHDWLCDVDASGYRDAYRAFAAEDGPSEQDLKNLHCPALFLTGANEPNSTPAMSRRMGELAPQGRSEILSDAAHMLPMTHAALVNAILKQFIREHAK